MIGRLLASGQALVRDLVDKRLWPIALALVVALVAVPVVIGSSSGGDEPEQAVTVSSANAAGPGAPAAVIAADPVIIGRSRPGAVSDPFYAPAKPKQDRATSVASVQPPPAPLPSRSGGAGASPAPAAAAPKTPTSQAGGAPDPAAPTAGPTRTPTPTPTPTPATRATATAPDAPPTSLAAATARRTVHRTRLRWGQDEDAEVRGVSRLQPLGDLSSPALLYLGTTRHGARAVFLLGPDAVADGTGGCAEAACRAIALKAGESTVVEVVGEDGEKRRFRLEIDAVVRRVLDSTADAAALRARVYPVGRAVLRRMIRDAKTAAAIGQFAFDAGAGAVVARTARSGD